MICPDINLLLYATFSTYPQHRAAKAWWDGLLSTVQPVRIGHVVILGYIRIATNARVFSTPLTIQQAIDVVDGWLGQPNVELIAPATAHWDNLRAMLSVGATGGNLTTDAHIAHCETRIHPFPLTHASEVLLMCRHVGFLRRALSLF